MNLKKKMIENMDNFKDSIKKTWQNVLSFPHECNTNLFISYLIQHPVENIFILHQKILFQINAS